VAEHCVRVHDLTPRHCADERLSVVPALCFANDAISDGSTRFLPDAVAPSGEWRIPTADELSGFAGAGGVANASDLSIVALPRLAGVLGKHLESRRRGDFSFLAEAVRAGIDDVVPFCVTVEDLVCHGRGWDPAACGW
jgi:hypothetical protein